MCTCASCLYSILLTHQAAAMIKCIPTVLRIRIRMDPDLETLKNPLCIFLFKLMFIFSAGSIYKSETL